MFRVITYCLAASCLFVGDAFGGFGSPPWPSTNEAYSSGLDKDTRQSNVVDAIVERVEAIQTTGAEIDGYTVYTNATPYIYERSECVRFKAWVVSNCQYFLNTSVASGGTYNAWFAANPSAPFPRWTITGIVAHLSLPTNYFSQTPWQQLSGLGVPLTNEWTAPGYSELDYGWQYAPTVFSVLVWTEYPTKYYGVEVFEVDDCGVSCDTHDTLFAPVPPSDDCPITLTVPSTGFSYLSDLDQSLYEVAGQIRIFEMAASPTDPECNNVGLSGYYYSSRDTAVEFYQNYGYPMVRANKGPHLSNVAVSVDYYGKLGAWDSGCIPSATNYLVHYDSITASTGNWTDTSGNLGSGFGDEWENARVYIADDYFPREYAPPPYSTNCVNEEASPPTASSHYDPSCFGDAMNVFSNCFNTEYNATVGGASLAEANESHLTFTTRRFNETAAVLKWGFIYR